MRPSEIIFEVTEAPEGGYDARALGFAIFTQGEDWDDLNITVPRHRAIRTGTLNAITTEVAKFLDLPKQEVRKSLFG